MKPKLNFGVTGLLILICAACPNGKREVELADEFVITAFWGPPPEEVNIERYREITRAGIDILFPGNGIYDGEQNLKVLDLAKQAGIRIISFDTRVSEFAHSDDHAVDTAVIADMVNDYRDHPAFAGYVVRDEPAADMFPRLRDLCNLIREMDPGHEPFINLFPSYAGPERLGNVDFRSHVREFIETVRPGVLSYDHYALREQDTWYDLWFSDLAVVREETRRAHVPFWIFIQSEGIRGGLRVPTLAEIRWQANTALAFGARGLGWFTYWTPRSNPDDPNAEQHYNAMLDVDGNPTELYDFVRETNLYIKELGRGLMGWDNEFIARYEGGLLQEAGSSPVISPNGREANLVIGTFTLDARSRVVIANSRCDAAARFSLDLDPGWKMERTVFSIESEAGNDENLSGDWTLKPGGALVFELEAVEIKENK